MSAKPNIHILATGGTIAGIKSPTGGYVAGQLGIASLIDAVPGLSDIATITDEEVSAIGSQDMDDATWLKLARRLKQLAQDPAVDGIVVTHGTDTLEETAWFADLTVRTDQPVVFTGAMRPPTAPDPDGPANLLDAVRVAAVEQARGRGVLVVMNGTIHAARDVAKFHTARLDAFRSPERGPVGRIENGQPIFFQPPDPATPHGVFDVAALAGLPKVFILYAHAAMGIELIDAAAAAGAAGLIVAGVGAGNLTQAAASALGLVAARGVAVVRSTRVAEGTVDGAGEVDDVARGFVHAGGFKPGKARALLQLALLSTRDRADLQRIFDRS